MKIITLSSDFAVQYGKTFGDVAKGEPVVIKDDYVRIAVAINMGSYNSKHNLKPGDQVTIKT